MASSRYISWTHNALHSCDLQWVARSSFLVTDKPSMFCILTLIGDEGGTVLSSNL